MGTSDGMVNKIAKNIGVHEVEQIIRIEDVATPEEMNMALRMRTVEGKHVIPVPTFEIKEGIFRIFLASVKKISKKS